MQYKQTFYSNYFNDKLIILLVKFTSKNSNLQYYKILSTLYNYERYVKTSFNNIPK